MWNVKRLIELQGSRMVRSVAMRVGTRSAVVLAVVTVGCGSFGLTDRASAQAPGGIHEESIVIPGAATGSVEPTSRFLFGTPPVTPPLSVSRGDASFLGVGASGVRAARSSVQPLSSLSIGLEPLGSRPEPLSRGESGAGFTAGIGVDALTTVPPLPGATRETVTVPRAQFELGYDWSGASISGGGAFVPGLDGTIGQSTYLQGAASVGIPLSLTLGARLGYEWSETVDGLDREGVNWAIGISRDVLGFTFSLEYGGREALDTVCTPETSSACEQRLLFSIDRRF